MVLNAVCVSARTFKEMDCALPVARVIPLCFSLSKREAFQVDDRDTEVREEDEKWRSFFDSQ